MHRKQNDTIIVQTFDLVNRILLSFSIKSHQYVKTMELLYVWIEDYKNIHHQGFNFSPKYRFEFKPTKYQDEANKNNVTEGELFQLDQNGNRISKESSTSNQDNSIYENFFEPSQEVKDAWKNPKDESGKPIHLGTITIITAIIGRNGAGKSNLLEFIKEYEYYKESKGNLGIFFYKNKDFLVQHSRIKVINHCTMPISNNFGLWLPDIQKYDNAKVSIQQIIDFILYVTEKIKLKLPINLPDTINFEFKYNNIIQHENEINLKKHYENNPLPFEENKVSIKHFTEIDQIFLDFIFPKKSNDKEESLLSIKYKRKDLFLHELFKNFLLNFYYNLYNFLPNDDDFRKKFFENVITGINSRSDILSQNYFQDFENKGMTFLEKISEFITKLELSDLVFKELFQSFSNITKEVKNLLLESKKIRLVDENKQTDFNLRSNFDIKINEFENLNKILNSYDSFPSPFFNFKYSWRDLSAGELSLLSLYTNIEILSKNSDKNLHVIFLIDEGDQSFHPEWQRKYLKYLIDFLPQIYPDKQIQIILTTHSPFLASDLPKENIIFLQKAEPKTEEEKKGNYEIVNGAKYENGKCVVVDGLKKDKTFGANIHTLLSDSFFLNEGLIGEFAKGKIQEIMKDLGDKSKSISENRKDEIEKVIAMIGEPIIKRKLEQLFEDRFQEDIVRMEKFYSNKLEELKRKKEDKK
jgi:predicted ATPase